jgi:hypothetical protein
MLDKLVTLFDQGLSTRQIAKQIGMSKSYAHTLLSKLGLARSKSEAAVLRQPSTSKHWRTCRQVARNIWSRANGPIPKDYHIHHIDGNFTNNELSNLQCLTAAEHMRITHAGPEYHIPRHLRPARKAYMKAYLAEYHARKTRKL